MRLRLALNVFFIIIIETKCFELQWPSFTNALNLIKSDNRCLVKEIDIRNIEFLYPDSLTKLIDYKRCIIKAYSLSLKKYLAIKFERSDMVRVWWDKINSQTVGLSHFNNYKIFQDYEPMELYVSKQVQFKNGFIKYYENYNCVININKTTKYYTYAMEYIENSFDLWHWWKYNVFKKKLSNLQMEDILKIIMKKTYSSLMFLYDEKQLVYTDLKPFNILVNGFIDSNNLSVYLVDLESCISRKTNNFKLMPLHTPFYFPFEIRDKFLYEEKTYSYVDKERIYNRILSYTFCMTIYNILCSFDFLLKPKFSIICNTKEDNPTSKHLIDLLDDCIISNKISFKNITSHPWFQLDTSKNYSRKKTRY